MIGISMRHFVLMGGMLFAAAGCVELDVTNLDEPDRTRALSQPGDVEALIAGTFRTWWGLQQGRAPGRYLSQGAEVVTSSAANYGTGDMGQQPRIAVVNVTGYQWGYPVTDSWFSLNRALAAIRDGLQAISDSDLQLGDNGEDNPRILAFAKFMQGLAHGHLALLYDQAFILDETVELEDATLTPYDQVMTAALGYLAEARQIAGANSFTTESSWMAVGYSSDDIVRLTHSYEARFRAQVARDPAGRAAVDWATVLGHAQQGVIEDFGVEMLGPGGVWTRTFKSSTNGEGSGLALRALGPADQSGGWQTWEAAAPNSKLAFLIETDDRRINDGTPMGRGKYIETNAFLTNSAERGVWFQTNYSSHIYREINETSFGFAPDLTVSEMNFLIAEAHIRMNNPELALPIINASRVATGELPPATVTGVSGARCTPRTITGACGDLLETLFYEKIIENLFLSAGSDFFDYRGFGQLRSGTPIHLPVPAGELETLALPLYTLGGVGLPGGAN
jgi:hypothetical protein